MLDKQLLKGTIPMLVLKQLSRGDLYGYQLIKSLERISSGAFRFSEGTLYPQLHSLERDGMLRSYWHEPDSGRKRKYYSITDRGRVDLTARTREWREFADAIEAVLTKDGGHE